MTEFKAGTWYDIESAPRDEKSLDLWIKDDDFNLGVRLPDCWFCPDENAFMKTDFNGDPFRVEDYGIKALFWSPIPEAPEVS